jgi:hypothetical protein
MGFVMEFKQWSNSVTAWKKMELCIGNEEALS